MNGVLVVDKPAGPTSHDVVARIRRVLGLARVGHTGTLDPLATGVLPLVIGQACRLAQFLSAADKEYLADVRFGASTPTYDAEGRTSGADAAPPPAEPAGLSAAAVEASLEAFRGTYRQTPPPFSAKKIGGTPAYRLARTNRTVTVEPVVVTVSRLDLEEYDQGLARLRLVCSSGFYVRALAHELGLRLGCGAYLAGLRRTRAGDFSIESAAPLDVIQAEGSAAAARMTPMAALLPFLPQVVLNADGVRRASHGNALSPVDFDPQAPHAAPPAAADGLEPGRVRLIDRSGTLLGIAERRPGGILHPMIVLM